MQNICELCVAINEPRVITKNASAFAMICKNPLKKEHVLVMPIKHATKLTELQTHEAQNFVTLVEEMKELVKQKSGTDVLVVQNSGVHSTEPHIHFHVFPSKGSLRKLVSTFEGIPDRPIYTNEELATFAKELGS